MIEIEMSQTCGNCRFARPATNDDKIAHDGRLVAQELRHGAAEDRLGIAPVARMILELGGTSIERQLICAYGEQQFEDPTSILYDDDLEAYAYSVLSRVGKQEKTPKHQIAIYISEGLRTPESSCWTRLVDSAWAFEPKKEWGYY